MGVVTVIVGAGASRGLNATPYATDDEGFRPPLTTGILKPGPRLERLLGEYPGAAMIATELDRYLKQNPGIGFEQGLKHFQKQAALHHHIARQFIQVPVYLNHFFGEVTAKFTRRPKEYIALVNLALACTDRVLFISLNYDALLEMPLREIELINFNREEQYIENRKWALLKPHGSCHWYRRIRGLEAVQVSPGHYLGALHRSPYPPDVEEGFVIHGIGDHARWFLGEKVLLYPALTVPIEGKYEMNCPVSHVAEARRLLRETGKYLIIGSSLKDTDLLDLLRDNASLAPVRIVGNSEKGANDAAQRLADSVPELERGISPYQEGFAQFVDGGHLEKFFNDS